MSNLNRASWTHRASDAEYREYTRPNRLLWKPARRISARFLLRVLGWAFVCLVIGAAVYELVMW